MVSAHFSKTTKELIMKATSFNLTVCSTYHGNLDKFFEEKSDSQNGILTCPASPSQNQSHNGIPHFIETESSITCNRRLSRMYDRISSLNCFSFWKGWRYCIEPRKSLITA